MKPNRGRNFLAGALPAVWAVALVASPVPTAQAAGPGRIAFAANWQGNWDLYHVAADGSDLRRLTSDPADERDPAWSPDGKSIAFRSNRDGNWELYRLDLETGTLLRLTHDPAFDGQPAWSPDGKSIAFVSTRAGDPDIFIVPAAGGEAVNLTPGVPQGDFAPAWSPNGRWIAFTSWRLGDNDLFLMDPDGGQVRQLTESPSGEEWPVWSPDGRHLAFVLRKPTGTAIYTLDVADPLAEGGKASRATWLGADAAPAWSPDGGSLAFLQRQANAESLWVQAWGPPDALAQEVLQGFLLLDGPLSWNGHAGPWGIPVSLKGRSPLIPGMEPKPQPAEGRPGFFRVADLVVPNARFNARIVHSFLALRERVREETGWDFLGELSDAWRPLDADDETSSYGSWHKAGRAFDMRFDLRESNGVNNLEVVRQDLGNRTYWRVYLRAEDQSGTQGEPLFEEPWDLSGRARRRHPDQGGQWKPIPLGYYVDLTALARQYGWQRIPAVHQPDFSWTWHFLAIEYWHLERPDDLTWYQALLEVYPAEEVEEVFHWRRLEQEGQPMYLWWLNGVPVPPEAQAWLDVRP
ncbi:MAG: TolB family protein [Anaerolineae bacterium]